MGFLRAISKVATLCPGANVPTLIEKPTRIEAAGEPPKLIDEYAGRVNNGEERLSIAHMRSPSGWSEPGQTPEFDEYTIVLRGQMQVRTRRRHVGHRPRPGRALQRRRVDSVLHPGPGRLRVHRSVPAGVQSGIPCTGISHLQVHVHGHLAPTSTARYVQVQVQVHVHVHGHLAPTIHATRRADLTVCGGRVLTHPCSGDGPGSIKRRRGSRGPCRSCPPEPPSCPTGIA